MKVSQLLLCIGLASAAAVPQHAGQGLARRDPDPSVDVFSAIAKRANLKRDLVARRIEAWNSFTTSVSGLDACVVLQALEFLAASLVEATEDITTDAGTQVFVAPSQQGGPVVLDMRSMMIWQSILDRFKDELQVTNAWSLTTQLEVASCYLGYSRQAGLFLQALFAHAGDFSTQDPVRCLMFDKIQALYVSYNNVANLIYGGNNDANNNNGANGNPNNNNDGPQNTEFLVTGNFPNSVPANFRTPYPRSAPNSRIRDYLAQHDTPEPSSGERLFQMNLDMWRCSDINQVPAIVVDDPNNTPNGAGAPAAAAGAPAAGAPAAGAPAAGAPAAGAPAAGAPGAAALAAARRDTFEGKADPKIEELGRKLGRLGSQKYEESTDISKPRFSRNRPKKKNPKKGPKRGPKKDSKKDSKKDAPKDVLKEAKNDAKKDSKQDDKKDGKKE